jgi:osmotically-inducible protein OsmY
MKRLSQIACCNVAALLVLSIAASAQTTPPAKPAPAPPMTKTTTKSKAKASAPKTDAEIQKCIEDKLSASKLKADGFTVAVSGGDSTLTGSTKAAGHKSNAAQFAKRCGATKVTNNITVESTPKTKAAKTADGAAAKTPVKP